MLIPTPPTSLDGLLLLYGRLQLKHSCEGKPYLTITVWCPTCKGNHYHSWNPADGPADASHRAAHCQHPRDGLFAGYRIAMDPVFEVESRRILRRFSEQ